MSASGCDQCKGSTKTGKRCSRHTCSAPECWQHSAGGTTTRAPKKAATPTAKKAPKPRAKRVSTRKPKEAPVEKKEEAPPQSYGIAEGLGEQISRREAEQRYYGYGEKLPPWVTCSGKKPYSMCLDTGRNVNKNKEKKKVTFKA